MKPNMRKVLVLLLGVLLICSCGLLAEPLTVKPTADIAPTGLLLPTSTFAPRQTPIYRASPSPDIPPGEGTPYQDKPIQEELPVDHPLSIEFLQRGKYPGSAITNEQELEPGSNYRRYYVSYRSEDLKIYALLTVPNGETPEEGWPVIIFNHGYVPPHIYRTTERYEAYVDELARRGYIVFRSDYRGHHLSEGEARGAYGYPDYTIDVLNAVESIKTYTGVNPDSIGMWGHSMGGYLTLRSMVISKDIKVGVIWAGVVAPYTDLVYNWPGQTYETPEQANSWRTSLEATYGSPAENPVFWDCISANSYLTELSGPIQLHHGTGDVEVPVEFSTELYQRLLNIDAPVELYIYDNDNHNISNSFDLAMRRTIDFFERYLKEP